MEPSDLANSDLIYVENNSTNSNSTLEKTFHIINSNMENPVMHFAAVSKIGRQPDLTPQDDESQLPKPDRMVIKGSNKKELFSFEECTADGPAPAKRRLRLKSIRSAQP